MIFLGLGYSYGREHQSGNGDSRFLVLYAANGITAVGSDGKIYLSAMVTNAERDLTVLGMTRDSRCSQALWRSGGFCLLGAASIADASSLWFEGHLHAGDFQIGCLMRLGHLLISRF